METPLVLRPIRFPLKLKLISLFSLVLLTSLAAYAHYALTRFIEDKSAYIFSSVQEAATTQAKDIEQTLQESKRALVVMAQINDANRIKSVFESFPALIDYREYSFESTNFTLGIADPAALTRNELEREQVEANITKIVTQIKSLPLSQDHIFYLYSGKPIATIIHRLDEVRTQIIHVGLADILARRSDSIKTTIIGPRGEELQPSLISTEQLFKIAQQDFINKNIKQGVVEKSINAHDTLIGLQQSNSLYPISIASIGKDDAFSVAQNLIEKSYLFAVFLLSLAIIIGILFSRSLTKSLEVLFQGTQSFVGGNFESRVDVNSSDEIGALSDSFNYMGKKIVDFMAEMKEKIRLEREVEVAKLVQDSFFPEMNGAVNGATFSAFYTPASECGGDWWGHLDTQNKSIILIADATGHGVPAALITATANCALHTLEEVLKERPNLANHPDKILEWFNRAICGAGKQLYMTMFCLVVDSTQNKMRWSNAAHNPPLLLPSHIENPTRQNLSPLLTPPSPHLGKDLNSKFPVEESTFSPNDLIVLYTDGIVENTNTENKAYGERRFHQSIVEAKDENITLWCQKIAKLSQDFCLNQPSDDDVTLVLCRLGANKDEGVKHHSATTVISQLEADQALDFLFTNPQVDHLVGANSPRLQEELEAVPPLVKDFIFNWQGHELNNFRNEFNSLLDDREFPGWFESPRDYLRLISDELVTNALVPDGSQVSVGLSVNDKEIAVIVEDNKGLLDKKTLLNSLKRARDSHAPKEGGRGAGLGLYLVYQSTNQIWIDVRKNQGTKIICILEATKRYKNFKGRHTSFHFRTQEHP